MFVKAFERTQITIGNMGGGDRLKWYQQCTDGNNIVIGSSMGMALSKELARESAIAKAPTSDAITLITVVTEDHHPYQKLGQLDHALMKDEEKVM